MEAGFGRLKSPLWLVILLGLTVLALGNKAHSGAAANEPRASASNSPVVFIPMTAGFSTPSVELVPFATGFKTDTIMDIANAGDERLFVVERKGIVRIVWPDGNVEPTPFLDISDDVSSNLNWEQGLLGLAFHPDFPEVPYIYVAYTDISSIRIGRVELNPVNHNQALPNTMKFLMVINKSRWGSGSNPAPSPVHNGGDLTFGPDGYLYIPLGDGGPDPYAATNVPGDPLGNSQSRSTALGSMLRIDVNEGGLTGPDCGDRYYTIPPGNPFTTDSGCDEIWATGLRNPWRIDFDPLNGTLFVADVGEWRREEINVLPLGTAAGANFGWHCYEGTINYQQQWDPDQFAGYFRNCGPRETFHFPAFEYDHSQGECSLTGGVVYRGQAYPFFSGRYLYTDFCTGRIWSLRQIGGGQWKSEQVGQSPVPITTFGRDSQGEVYAGMRDFNGQANGDVTLYKLVIK